MPVKQILDLEWEKENTESRDIEQKSGNDTERRTGPTLRSTKNKQTLNEIKEQVETIPTKDKEQICTDFFSVSGTVIAAGVYKVAAQFINAHLF